MGVLELIVPVGKRDVKGFGKAVSKIVGGAGLQRLSVVHHGLDGVSGLGAGVIDMVQKEGQGDEKETLV